MRPPDGVKHGAGHHGLDRREPGFQGIVEAAMPRGFVGGHVGNHVHAHGAGHAHFPVRGEDKVAGQVHGVAAAHLGCFLAQFGGIAGDDALPLPGDGGGVQVPDGHHERIQFAELAGVQRRRFVAGCRRRKCVHACDPSHRRMRGQSAQRRLARLPKTVPHQGPRLHNLYSSSRRRVFCPHPTDSHLTSLWSGMATLNATYLGVRREFVSRAPSQQAAASPAMRAMVLNS